MVLDELYYGNIYPSEQILVRNNEYHKLCKCTVDKRNQKNTRELNLSVDIFVK